MARSSSMLGNGHNIGHQGDVKKDVTLKYDSTIAPGESCQEKSWECNGGRA